MLYWKWKATLLAVLDLKGKPVRKLVSGQQKVSKWLNPSDGGSDSARSATVVSWICCGNGNEPVTFLRVAGLFRVQAKQRAQRWVILCNLRGK